MTRGIQKQALKDNNFTHLHSNFPSRGECRGGDKLVTIIPGIQTYHDKIKRKLLLCDSHAYSRAISIQTFHDQRNAEIGIVK